MHPDAVIIGDVRVGAESSVWPGAVLRGDTGHIEVGARTSVQDGCVVHTTEQHPTLIGDDCVVGHLAHLEGCTIGPLALIGVGAVVLHRVVVGEGATVAANAVVLNDTEVPPGALAVGTPAVIKPGASRPEAIADGRNIYVERTRCLPGAAAPHRLDNEGARARRHRACRGGRAGRGRLVGAWCVGHRGAGAPQARRTTSSSCGPHSATTPRRWRTRPRPSRPGGDGGWWSSTPRSRRPGGRTPAPRGWSATSSWCRPGSPSRLRRRRSWCASSRARCSAWETTPRRCCAFGAFVLRSHRAAPFWTSAAGAVSWASRLPCSARPA